MRQTPSRDYSIANSLPHDMFIHRLVLNVYFDEFNCLDSLHTSFIKEMGQMLQFLMFLFVNGAMGSVHRKISSRDEHSFVLLFFPFSQ